MAFDWYRDVFDGRGPILWQEERSPAQGPGLSERRARFAIEDGRTVFDLIAGVAISTRGSGGSVGNGNRWGDLTPASRGLYAVGQMAGGVL